MTICQELHRMEVELWQELLKIFGVKATQEGRHKVHFKSVGQQLLKNPLSVSQYPGTTKIHVQTLFAQYIKIYIILSIFFY